MVLPLVLHEDRIGKNLFHVRDVPLAGGTFRLAVPVSNGTWRTKNGFGHGVVVREIECPPDRIRAHAGQDYLPIQQIVPRELQRIREDIRHPHTERMKHDNDVGIPFSELMDRNLVRLHLFSGYLSREPGPAAVDPAAIVVVLLPVQIPQPFFLGVLHQYGHEPPEYERKEEKPEVPRHEDHPDAGEHERRVEWIADPRIDPRGPVFSRLLVHSRTPATSFFAANNIASNRQKKNETVQKDLLMPTVYSITDGLHR